MIEDWRKLFSFFQAREKRRIVVLLISTTLRGLLEAVGVASILPFIAVVSDPALVADNQYLSRAYTVLEFSSTNQFLVFLGIAALLVLVATNVLAAVNAWLTFRVCHLGEHDLACRLLGKYLNCPYQLLLRRNSSELVTNLVTEIERVVIDTLMSGIDVFSDAVMTVSIVALLLWVNPWVTIMTLLVLAVAYTIIYLLVTPSVVRLGSEFPALNAETYRNAQEALAAAKEIKVLGCEEHFVNRYSKPMLRLSRNAIAYNTLEIIPGQSLELIGFGGLLVAALFMIGSGETAGQIVPLLAMFAFAAYRLMPALKNLFDSVEEIRHNLVALGPLWQDYSVVHDTGMDGSTETLVFRSAIRLEDVSYRYSGDRQEALTGVRLDIRAGAAICFMGSTGAGKSTTVDVLLGLLQPSQGRLIVDGVPVTRDRLRAWQRNIGYVPQVAFLFDDTVANNIAPGIDAKDIDQKRVERAARIAEIHDFIVAELPQGYQSLVGERGTNLSGGQRQRIGIARALYRDPSVLVLDEATNELDLVTEGRILASLRSLADKTLIFVSHRASVAASCDDIVIFEKGRVVMRGSFAELAAPDSRYRELLEEPATEA